MLYMRTGRWGRLASDQASTQNDNRGSIVELESTLPESPFGHGNQRPALYLTTTFGARLLFRFSIFDP